MLAAGLEGIDNKYEMPGSLTKIVHEMSEEEITSLGIEALPGNLWEAIQVTEESDLVKKTLGDSVFNSFIENKKIEWNRYSSQISAYEVERYLPIL